MSHSEVFRPSDGPLLVRGNLSHGLKTPSKERPGTMGSSRFGNLSHNSFFARHNPHPGRVRHIKGLLDVPICAVNDSGFFANPRYSLQFPPSSSDGNKLKSYSQYINKVPVGAINVNSQLHPINTITGLQYFMGKPLNFRVFREKAVPKVGMVPVTDAWRDELRALTDAVGGRLPRLDGGPQHAAAPQTARPRTTQYSSETGRLIPPPSRAMSRQASRAGSRRGYMPTARNDHICEMPDTENVVLQMLCQILQTDDVNAVQSWLVSAGDREKSLVLDMIDSALISQPADPGVPSAPLPKLPEENYEGNVLGDENDVSKRIDRLSLDGYSRPASQAGDVARFMRHSLAGPPETARSVAATPQLRRDDVFDEDDMTRPPVTTAVFRNTTSRASSRPRTRHTPVGTAEPRLKFTRTPLDGERAASGGDRASRLEGDNEEA